MQSNRGCQSGNVHPPMAKARPVVQWFVLGCQGFRAPEHPRKVGLQDRFACRFQVAMAIVALWSAPLHAQDRSAESEIRAVIADMQAAWNRGDFQGYMRGFQNPGVVFVSRGQFQDDWQGTLDHYVRDYGGAPERRGTLHFYDIKVELLSNDAAQLISRYHLDRAESPQYGINTRLMRRVDGRWVIALNHVSSVETPDPNDPVEAHRQ